MRSRAETAAKQVKERGLHIDADGVCSETSYSTTEWRDWEVDKRVKAVTILANRLNTRRAIRELVLPELQAIQATLSNIRARLEQLESAGNYQAVKLPL